MAAGDKKPSTEDALEQQALAIGERLMQMHSFMQIRTVDVVDGVALVDRVGVGSFSYQHNSTAE